MENNSAANEPENKILSAVHSLNMMYNEKSLTTLNIFPSPPTLSYR